MLYIYTFQAYILLLRLLGGDGTIINDDKNVWWIFVNRKRIHSTDWFAYMPIIYNLYVHIRLFKLEIGVIK